MSLRDDLEVRTPRLLLRGLTPSDIDGLHAIVGDSAVTQWLSFDSRDRHEAQAMLDGILERAEREPRCEYYLAAALDERMIGFVRLGLNGVRAAKLGCAIAASHWGSGYASEMARASVRFGFESLHLHRISAAIGPDNHASMRVVEKAGFAIEGRLRDHVYTNGEWRDSILYSIINR